MGTAFTASIGTVTVTVMKPRRPSSKVSVTVSDVGPEPAAACRAAAVGVYVTTKPFAVSNVSVPCAGTGTL